LSTLGWLECSGTPVDDLAPLAGLRALQRLDFDRTQVGDLAPLAGLRGLRHLDLTDTPVADLSPVAHIRGLRVIGKGRYWRSRAGGPGQSHRAVRVAKAGSSAPEAARTGGRRSRAGRAQKSVQRPPTSQSP
jgi:Leucine-rich repeat (LRR) protein